MQVYPSYRYHRTLAPVIALDPAHELEVAHPNDGWAETPAAFLEDVAATEDATEWQPPADMTEASGPAAKPARKPRR
jgi:hypothetical protein